MKIIIIYKIKNCIKKRNLEKDIDVHKLVEKDLLHRTKFKTGENDTSIDQRTKTRYRTFYFKKKKDMEYFAQLKKEMKTSSENKNKEERNRNKINYIIDTPTLKKSNSTINIISKPSALEKRLLNYQKQIKQKKCKS